MKVNTVKKTNNVKRHSELHQNTHVIAAPKPSDYLDELDDADMTDAQKIEYLTILFNVMKDFAIMGFGTKRLAPEETRNNAGLGPSHTTQEL